MNRGGGGVLGLLWTEWLKIQHYRPFWVVFFLYPVSLGGIVAVSLWSQVKMQELSQGTVAQSAVSASVSS